MGMSISYVPIALSEITLFSLPITVKFTLLSVRENELKYPGTIKVTVIRETRAQEEAK